MLVATGFTIPWSQAGRLLPACRHAPTADSAGLTDKAGGGWGCPPRWMPPPAQSPAPPHPSAEPPPPPSWQKEPQLGSLWATYSRASAALGVVVQTTACTVPEKCHPALGEGVVAAIAGDELCHKLPYLQSTESTHHSICSVSHYIAHPIRAPINYARGNSTCHMPLLANPVSWCWGAALSRLAPTALQGCLPALHWC